MGNLNHFSGVVRILEVPREKNLNEKLSVLKCRVQLSQTRNNRLAMLNVWSRFAKDILKNYAIGDYILVEGYLSLKIPSKKRLSIKTSQISKKAEISVIKIYPYILNNNN